MPNQYDGREPNPLHYQSKFRTMAFLEETSNMNLTDPGTYDTVPEHPKFFNYTPKSEQPQEFMRNILMQQTHAAERDQARQSWHANHTFRKSRAAERHDGRRAVISRLNPDVDRKRAHLGVVDDSRLTITLMMPDGTSQKLREFKYQAPVDWHSKIFIAIINRWRSSIFNNYLLPTFRIGPRFQEEEDQWIRDNVIGSKIPQGGWPNIAARFNSQFEGRLLAGQMTPRPARTYTQVKSRRQALVAKATAMGRQVAKPRNRARNPVKYTAVDLPVEECD